MVASGAAAWAEDSVGVRVGAGVNVAVGVSVTVSVGVDVAVGMGVSVDVGVAVTEGSIGRSTCRQQQKTQTHADTRQQYKPHRAVLLSSSRLRRNQPERLSL